MANKIYVPSKNADDWKRFLAAPELQWKSGYSARTLAYCWEDADGFPKEVKVIFEQEGFEDLKLLLAIPEHKVPLPPRGHPSQNDLFVLAKASDNNLMTIAIEGKVAEPSGKTLAEWNANSTTGKQKRFAFLKELLGLGNIPLSVRYQFFHRSASAILEAQKFNARYAVMLVHSFSPDLLWFEDFQTFAGLYDIEPEPNQLYFASRMDDIDFYLAWVKGDPKYLRA